MTAQQVKNSLQDVFPRQLSREDLTWSLPQRICHKMKTLGEPLKNRKARLQFTTTHREHKVLRSDEAIINLSMCGCQQQHYLSSDSDKCIKTKCHRSAGQKNLNTTCQSWCLWVKDFWKSLNGKEFQQNIKPEDFVWPNVHLSKYLEPVECGHNELIGLHLQHSYFYVHVIYSH